MGEALPAVCRWSRHDSCPERSREEAHYFVTPSGARRAESRGLLFRKADSAPRGFGARNDSWGVGARQRQGSKAGQPFRVDTTHRDL